MPNNLELTPTNDLLDEIMNRHEHAVFAGMKTQLKCDSDILTIRRWSGNFATAAGLCTQLIHAINLDVWKNANYDEEIP